MSEQRARAAIQATGIEHLVVRHGPVATPAQAAVARGVEVDALVKTLVVRRGEEDYLLVLVGGARTISWPKLRTVLGVRRLSMPDAGTARAVTGYERGTITPFGSLTAWPVVADAALPDGPVALGGGAPGVALVAERDDVLRALGARVADVSEPVPKAPAPA